MILVSSLLGHTRRSDISGWELSKSRLAQRDRTTVVIVHRLQTARSADRVVTLHHGRIIEVSSHDKLLDRDGRYTAMWRAFGLVSQPRSASDLAV